MILSTIRMNCLNCFAMLLNYFARGNRDNFDGRRFRVEVVNKLASNAMPLVHTRYNHYFFQLENEGRRNLCTAAKEYAELGGVDRQDEDVPVYFDLTTLSFFIKCTTIPISHLKLLRDRIIVSVESNIFIGSYTFHLVIIDSNLRSCSEIIRNDEDLNSKMDEHELEQLIRARCFEEETVRMNRLSRMSENDRLSLCFAAWKCVEEFNPDSPLPAWQSNRVEDTPQMYAEIDENTKYVSLKCPTSPPTFVSLADTRNLVRVFLVED